MKTPYVVAVPRSAIGGVLEVDPVIAVVDQRHPDRPVCWCTDTNIASKIATALNRQYRDGAERRAAMKRG